MKKTGKSILYLTIIILIIIIAILVGIIIKNSNSTISVQEEGKAEQLTTTSTDNAYVDMTTHLSELASSSAGKLQIVQMTSGTFTVSTPGYYAGIVMGFSNNYADNGSSFGSVTITVSNTSSPVSGSSALTFSQTGNQRAGQGRIGKVYRLEAGDTIKITSSLQQGILRAVIALPDEDVTLNGKGAVVE